MSAISAGYAQGFLISKTIQTTVNGVDVEGHVEGSSFSITTTITKPFRNISQSWYIPYFAKGHCSFDGKYGEQRGQESLEDIYWLAEYVSRKADMLQEKLREFRERKAKISEGWITEGEFRMKRYTMRNQLQSGDISNRVYQRRIGSMRREVEALDKRLWKLEDNFFEAYFPMSVYGSMRESVIDVLDCRKPLS